MKSRPLGLGIATMLFSSCLWAGVSCQNLLETWHFEPKQLRTRNIYGISVSHLGRGQFGTVSRIQVGEHSFSIKRYKNEQDAALDALNLETLRTIKSKDLNIRIASFFKGQKDSDLWFEDIKGQNLHTIVSGPYDPKLKSSLLKRYHEFVERTYHQLSIIPNSSSRGTQMVNYYGSQQNVNILDLEALQFSIKVMLKPENFIVDAKTLELIIVDPN